MSIIYDALKKVEKTNTAEPAPVETKDKKTNLKFYLLYVLVVCIGLAIAGLSFSLFSHLPKGETQSLPPPTITEAAKIAPASEVKNTAVPETVPPKEEPRPQLALNGVFFSADKGYALINNQILKEGDTIEGATVLHIGRDNVELKFKDSSFKLPSPK